MNEKNENIDVKVMNAVENYEVPRVEVIEVVVEKGYANSSQIDGLNEEEI